MPQFHTMPAKTSQSSSAEAASIRLCLPRLHSGRFSPRFLPMCRIRKKLDHSNSIPSHERSTGLHSQGWIYRMITKSPKNIRPCIMPSSTCSQVSFQNSMLVAARCLPSQASHSHSHTAASAIHSPCRTFDRGRGCNSRLGSRTGRYKAIRTGRRPQKNYKCAKLRKYVNVIRSRRIYSRLFPAD
jgi:hypothetical protein